MGRRQNDIEIYVREADTARLVAWAATRFSSMTLVTTPSDPHVVHHANVEGASMAVVVQTGIEHGPFTSIWFNPNLTHWDTDVACARDAAAELRVEIRCDPGTGSEADGFLWIHDGREELFEWSDELIEAERVR